MPDITNANILIMATNGFEQSELFAPLEKLRAAGASVHVATPDGEAITGWDKDKWGRKCEADLKIDDVSHEDYIALVLPGGQINPDILRTQDEAVNLVRDFVSGDKVVAAICHAPWLLVEAGVVQGREMTSYHSIQTDVKNAGANWVDKEVAVDNGVITSRNPDDLDAFVAKIIEEIEEGEHKREAA